MTPFSNVNYRGIGIVSNCCRSDIVTLLINGVLINHCEKCNEPCLEKEAEEEEV